METPFPETHHTSVEPGPWNLFLDDERNPPRDGREWVVARSVRRAKQLILTLGMPAYASLDHDLGDGGEGWEVVRFIQDLAFDTGVDLSGFDFYVHSQNCVGGPNIEAYRADLRRMDGFRTVTVKVGDQARTLNKVLEAIRDRYSVHRLDDTVEPHVTRWQERYRELTRLGVGVEVASSQATTETIIAVLSGVAPAPEPSLS